MSAHTLQQLQSGELKGIKRLDLSCGLTEFPSEIFDLADNLEVLNLSSNQLSSLPNDLWRLHKMQIIFCSDNLFTELPAVLGACPALTMIGFKANQIASVPAASLPKSLRWLVLTDNRIVQLPDSLGDCVGLQKLMLAGNQLRELPVSMVNCQQLELIRLAANQFAELPACLFELPRLSWLALGGNPLGDDLVAQRLAQQNLAQVPWSALTVGSLLGEGASGAIYQAQYCCTESVKSGVALKLFKGQVTSDGLPETEMATCSAAGSHPNLIGVLARLVGHPECVQGLLVPLILPEFSVLARPPSLVSCTRDMYADDLSLSVSVAIHIARCVASAAAHLHQRGVLHGDLYAHNVLRNADGYAYLGDFGAAAFYDKDSLSAQWIERVEVRAFSCLLEELLARVNWSSDLAQLKQDLYQLQSECAQAKVMQRPDFVGVLAALGVVL
ncbi:leucine-rich repeat-containing serine/threonine-protein kinase [Deefgea tanakiae]|uniref:Leucine-rich repeat-containing serine/threonine-protein kinase n=1 Tax=Deefgea tanakiae TaxID=2865840 RepID=A0ABX8Z8F6_9NEIS|nr:leucine-rich repeat-containing protein kinase family protein [Deefgea tanakiae]QZA78853.1 leucine-rich repeat-containing serine/threonine-protein kinase [Deefgea tanakiae]